MEKMEIKEYLQELLDKWNKYDELDGFTADSFRNDLEKLLEYWDLRIKEEPVRIFYAGDMCVGSSNKPKKQPEKEVPVMKVEDENGSYWVAHIEEYPEEPEKQEEWREGLDNIDLMLAMLQSIENCTDEEVRNTAKAIREELDKVSQLLSERTFTKEELKVIEEWYDGMLYPTNPDEKDKLVHDKLSKLLKEK